MLIDADLAEEMGSGRSGARNRTGMMEFMAIKCYRVSHTLIAMTSSHFSTAFFGPPLADRGREGFRFCSGERVTEVIDEPVLRQFQSHRSNEAM